MAWRLAPALFLLTACLNAAAPPEAPDALDDNLRWFWANAEALDDNALTDGASKLARAGKADTRTTSLKSQMRTRLSAPELAVVGLDQTNDPSVARGMMLVNLFPCSLARLEKILIERDQKAQYGVYDDYSRTYETDFDGYATHDRNRLAWAVDAKATLPIDDVYTSKLKGSIRRVVAPADSATRGTFLVARTWLIEPATFSPASGSYFRQDYQVELFWQQTPDTIFHAYAIWRDIKVGGFNLTIEDNGFMNLVLDNLVKWDDKTAELCTK